MSDRYTHPVDPSSLRFVNAGRLVNQNVIPQIAGVGRETHEGRFFYFCENNGNLQSTRRAARDLSSSTLRFVTGPGINDESSMRQGRVMFDYHAVGLWIQVPENASVAFGQLMENGGTRG